MTWITKLWLIEAVTADTNLFHIKIITLAFKIKQANTKVTIKNNSLTQRSRGHFNPKKTVQKK